MIQRSDDRKTNAELNGGVPPAGSELAEPGPIPISEAGRATVTAAMGAAWVVNPAVFAQLARQQAQARRDYYRALKHLKDLRTGKVGYLPEQKSEKSETKPATVEQEPPTAPKFEPDTPEKSRTNPAFTNYDLKWENPKPLFVYDPTLMDRLAQPAKARKNPDDEIFTTRTGR